MSIALQKNLIKYTIAYEEIRNAVKFTAEHTILGYMWNQIINEDLGCLSGSKFQHVIDPKLLFRIMTDYAEGNLNKYATVKFQESMKGEDDGSYDEYKDISLSIEIITVSPFDETQTDTKQILLDANTYLAKEDINRKRIKRIDSTVSDIQKTTEELRKSVNLIDSHFHGVDENIYEIESTVSDIQKTTEDLFKNVNLINSHIHGVDASVNDMWNSIGNLQNVVNEINSPISDVKETMENLKTVVDGIDLANDDLWKEMRRLDGMTKDVRNRQDELGSRVEKYQKDNKATQDILSYSVMEMNKILASFGERIKCLETKMNTCVDGNFVGDMISDNCYTKSESNCKFAPRGNTEWDD